MPPKTPGRPDLRSPLVLAESAKVGTTIPLDASQLAKLAFREINVKEAFTLVDARGTFFRASLKAADAGRGAAEVYEQMAGSTESPARITLVCAVLARQRMITVVQKAAELGCVRVVPVLSDHSVQPRDLEKEKPWAWPGQALKGARQCRRASVPEVLAAAPLAQAMSAPYWAAADAVFWLDDVSDSAASSRGAFAGAAPSGDYVLAVGPEGGWSDAERARIQASGARVLRLGTRVLRAETAVFAGLSVLQHRLGDM